MKFQQFYRSWKKEAISEAVAEQYTVVDRKEDAWGMKHLKLEKQTEGVTVDSDNVIIHLDKKMVQ